MYRQRIGLRAEHRELESQRARSSPTLSDRFQKLKSLTVSLGFYDADGVAKNSQVTYTVNLDNTRSVFRFNCPNSECIQGDFDLTKPLARAVAKRQTTLKGELCCDGWRNKEMLNSVHCHNILRYKLSLAY